MSLCANRCIQFSPQVYFLSSFRTAAAASALHAQPFTSAPHLLSRIRGIETEIGHEAVRINVRRGEGRSSVAR